MKYVLNYIIIIKSDLVENRLRSVPYGLYIGQLEQNKPTNQSAESAFVLITFYVKQTHTKDIAVIIWNH